MAPKRATRSTPVTENPTTTTVTNAQLQAMIDQGVTAALAARDAKRIGDDSHTSGRELYVWNSHVRIVGHDVAYAMTWIELRKKMTDKYCPRNEIKKLEAELWNLKVKGTDVTGYNQRFQELALLCVGMFPEESDKVERYVGGLPDMIHGSVVASKPKTMQEATEMATELMDKKISTFAERQAENKRKLDNNNFLRGRMWLKFMPLGLVKGRSMPELYHYATSANFTTMARALAEAQLFVGIDKPDDGIVQAGSGVAGLSSVRGFHQLCLRSSGIVVLEGLTRASVVVQAEYSAEAAVFDELGAAVLVD
ncbi:reverse transcriptase domain-containing protein [Tanacetum coccineum]